MSDVSAVTHLLPTANEGFVSALDGSISSGASVVPLTTVTGLTNGLTFVGIIEPGQPNQQTFTGIVDTAASEITGVHWTRGTNTAHSDGVAIVDYVTGTHNNMHTKWAGVEHNDDGTHDNVTATSITASNGIAVTGGSVSVPAGTLLKAALEKPHMAAVFFSDIVGQVISTQTRACLDQAHSSNYGMTVTLGNRGTGAQAYIQATRAGMYQINFTAIANDVPAVTAQFICWLYISLDGGGSYPISLRQYDRTIANGLQQNYSWQLYLPANAKMYVDWYASSSVRMGSPVDGADARYMWGPTWSVSEIR